MAQSLRSVATASSWFAGSLTITVSNTAVGDVLVFIGSGDSQGSGFVPLTGWTILHDLKLAGMRQQVHYMRSSVSTTQFTWQTDHFTAMGAVLSIAGAIPTIDAQSSTTIHTSSFNKGIPAVPINTTPSEFLIWAVTADSKKNIFPPSQLEWIETGVYVPQVEATEQLTICGKLFPAGGVTPAAWCNGQIDPTDEFCHISFFAFKNPAVAINPQLFSEV